jgi:hypothetical protein
MSNTKTKQKSKNEKDRIRRVRRGCVIQCSNSTAAVSRCSAWSMYVKTKQVKTFKDLEFDALDMGMTGQAKRAAMQFDNGYSISVIAGKHYYSSPRENDLDSSKYESFEIAIFGADGCYATGEFFLSHHEGSVAGWQSKEQIDKVMKQIQEK